MNVIKKIWNTFWEHKRVAFAVLSVLVIVMAWMFFVEGDRSSSTMDKKMMQSDKKKEIETVLPKLQVNSNSLILLGEVISHETAHIYPRRQGIIKDVYVDVGDTVYENQVVATLLPRGVEGESATIIAEQKARRNLAAVTLEEAKDVEDDVVDAAEEKVDELEDKRDRAREARDAAIAKAEADIAAASSASEIAVAEAERDRVKAVEDAKVEALEAEIETAKDAADAVEEGQEKIVASAEASLSVADAALTRAQTVSGHISIRSPFSGVIAKRYATVGEMLGSSSPAFRLSDVPTTLAKKAKDEIIFGLPEDAADALSLGDEVVFFTAYGQGREYTAEITRKSPEVDEDTRDFRVHAKIIGDHNLVHQTSIRVRVVTDEHPRYAVPSKSIKRIDDENYVWILKDEMKLPERLHVTVHTDDGEFADISGEISDETRIVKRLTDKITMPMTEESAMMDGDGIKENAMSDEMIDDETTMEKMDENESL